MHEEREARGRDAESLKCRHWNRVNSSAGAARGFPHTLGEILRLASWMHHLTVAKTSHLLPGNQSSENR